MTLNTADSTAFSDSYMKKYEYFHSTL